MVAELQRFLGDGLLTSASVSPDKIAVIAESKEYSYRILEQHAKKLAMALVNRGLRQGDRVAIYMDNTWECVVSIYGVSLAGGVFLVVNHQTKADKLHYILDDADAVLLLTEAGLKSQLVDSVKSLEILKAIIVCGNKEDVGWIDDQVQSISVEDFDQLLSASDEIKECRTITPSDLAALIYTSGSTGEPKGVMHTHLSMTFALGSLVEYLRLSDKDVMLNVLPLAFDYGLYQLLMSVYLGATLVLEKSIAYPASIFRQIREHSVTSFPGVPTIYSMLLTIHRREPLQFPSVTRVTNTAAALPADYIEELQEIFPSALIYRMYGLTECKRVTYLEPELINDKSDSVGKAIPGTEVFILDEKGQPVRPGEVGILHVRGPHLMTGYWKKPDATDEMIKQGKWQGDKVLCTHDKFYADDEGFLYFVGRTDDIIKTRGEKVSPIEVENVLHSIEGIREAAVVGMSDDFLGQKIRAYVSIEATSDLNENKIKRFCARKLENYMVPQEVVILDELPKTDTGKITKKLLR